MKYCIILRHVSKDTENIYFSDAQHIFLTFLITEYTVRVATNTHVQTPLTEVLIYYITIMHSQITIILKYYLFEDCMQTSIILNVCSWNKRKFKINIIYCS